MSYTQRFTEMHQLLAHIPADSETTEINSGFVSLAAFHRAVILISVGDIQASGTFDVTIDQATDTGGSSSKALSGKSITQLTQAGGDGDDAVAIEIQTAELDVTNGFDCINVRVSPATAASEFSVMIFGCIPRFPPVTTTAWAEIVT